MFQFLWVKKQKSKNLLYKISIFSRKPTEDGDYRELDTTIGKTGDKLNIIHLISVAVK